MKIPSCFYGTHKKVKTEVSKLYTQIRKGKSLEEIFSKFELLDVNDYPSEYFSKYDPEFKVPNNLIWISMGVPFGGGLDHFILSAFSDPLYRLSNLKIPWEEWFEERYKMQLKLVPFLATSEWGCVILNNQQSEWYWSPKCGASVIKINGKEIHRGPIDPDFAFWIIESSVKYWDNLILLGNKFFNGLHEGTIITKCRPLCHSVLFLLGCEMEETFYGDEELYAIMETRKLELSEGLTPEEEYKRIVEWEESSHRCFKFGHVKEVCEKYSLLDRLKNDEDFRNKALEGTLLKRLDDY